MTQHLLEDMLRVAGEAINTSDVELVGADPVLPTPFRIGELGAAAIAACGLQAARLYEARTGRSQGVEVHVDAAAAAMRSSRYLQPRAPVISPLHPVGFYETRDDRWIFLQRLFHHHREAQLRVLGSSPNEQAIAAAVARFDAFELEQRIIEQGACASVVRTREEWELTGQAAALRSLPLFEIHQIGDSQPEPLPQGTRPLSGIRVLDLTRVLAGPICARTLAEHGADVLRVGTPSRPDDEQMSRDTGHGKRSSVLDLKTVEGAERLCRLAEKADIFAQGYRPGAVAALGFAPDDVATLRPGIVYVSISAYGREGSWWDRRGFDSVVQAASGICSELIDASGRPSTLPANPLDYTTGYLAAFGSMVALSRRARAGGSYHIQVSLAQTASYLARLPRVDAGLVIARPPELDAHRLQELMTTRDTPFGALRYLRPVAQLSLTPAHWERPTVPVDHDPPEWEG